MRVKIIGLFAIVILFIACSKDKFQTKPSLKLKSISNKTVNPGEDMNVELEYTDKEGDIVNDSLVMIKVRTNLRPTTTLRDTLLFRLPKEFPTKNEGLIDIRLDYNNHLTSADNPPSDGAGGKESDSLTMKFILKDNGSHVSDTLVIKDIVIKRS